MLGDAWLFITALLIIIAIILKQPPLLIIGLLFFLTSGVGRLWSRYSLRNVEYRRSLSSPRSFFGDHVTLEITITNRKFLPLPWLHIEEEVSEELDFVKVKTVPTGSPGRSILSSFVSVGWYDRLIRRYPVRCVRRGYFTLGPATINSGDPFGFFRQRLVVEDKAHLVVYPRMVPLEELGIPSRHPFGDLRVRRHLFEDPVQVMTTRDYVTGDPLRRIHWKATARSQTIQTRVFEHTTTVDLALFLDTRTVGGKYYWGNMVSDFLETAVIAAASISNYALRQDYKVGLYVNEYYRDSDRPLRIPPSDHPDQLKNILEALAHVRGVPHLTIERILGREARALTWEATIVMIATVVTEELVATMRQFRRAGRRLALVLVGDNPLPAGLEGMPIYRVSEEIYHRQSALMRLEEER